MSIGDRIAAIIFSFIPWLLLWVMYPAFTPTASYTAFQQAVMFVGPAWLIMSPLVTMLGLTLFRK